ncbi:MAG: GNAT family N-acetyltransferase [Anaerolineales bacterium]|nr:GNAT family N-acetyltransferase [Anaerolineales bacterium]
MTANITIRRVEGSEMLDILYWLDNYAFRPTPPFPNREEWEGGMKTRERSPYYALFEDEKALAITACPKMTQNLRGKIFQMGGFADVSTHPEARRKGYSRQLIRYVFAQLVKEGDVLSSLYPFRESFYERLGYVTFPQTRQAIFKPAALSPLLGADLGGEVELVLMGEGFEAYRAFVEKMQPGVHGMAVFTDVQGQREAAQKNRSWLAQAKVGGQVEGLMVYNLKGEEMMNYDLRAVRLYYRTSQAKYLLLAWLARHIDQAGKIELWLPSYEQPNTWFADIRPKLEPVFVAPMGRVLDVSAIGGMETGPECFSAQISDPHCPWNNGVWVFEGGSGHLEVTPAPPSGLEPDCHLTIQGLSALVYGVNDPADFSLRGWGDPPPHLQATLRKMFPQKLPYLHEYY